MHPHLVELEWASEYCFDRAKTSDLGSLAQALSIKMLDQNEKGEGKGGFFFLRSFFSSPIKMHESDKPISKRSKI